MLMYISKVFFADSDIGFIDLLTLAMQDANTIRINQLSVSATCGDSMRLRYDFQLLFAKKSQNF